MPKQNVFINNRKGQKLAVIIEKARDQKGLVFVMHGLGGFKEQAHIQVFADAFRDKGFTVILFDTTNTLGESDGKYEDATITSYYEDLEDVITWAKDQDGYEEPFWLAGHSLGGICTALFAQKYPDKVKALAPISAVISAELHTEAIPKEKLEEYNRTGWKINPSKSKPGIIKKLNWKSFNEDLQKYDLLLEANKLTIPVLLIVGEKDISTPPRHQKLLYEKLPGEKELHIIKEAPHTFKEKEQLDEIKQIFKNWIEKYI